MNKVLIIIPYFGTLPNWFQTFLESCRNTEILDFLLITDDNYEYNYPKNFTVEYWEFSHLQNIIKNKLGQKTYIDHPYKLCDYKPLYGFFFEEYLKDYKFWAHSDIDVIFGQVDSFLKNIDYDSFDRVFPYGHFSIYRNEKENNLIFQEKLNADFPDYFDIDFVKRTTYPCHFDEIGMNIIIKQKNKKFYEKGLHKNINLNYYNFSVGNGKHKNPKIILYENGKVFTLEKLEDNQIKREEHLYIHIQNRKFFDNLQPAGQQYIICRDGFLDYTENDLDSYFLRYGLNDNLELQKDFELQKRINSRKSQKQKLFRELKKYPLRAFYNIYHRYESIKYLKTNNLF